jgi:hypothetical protein
MFLVHQAPGTQGCMRAVAPGVQALSWHEFVKEL